MDGQTNEGFPNGPGSNSASMKSSKSSRPAAIRNPYAVRRPSLGGSKTLPNQANSSNSASSSSSSKLASERVLAPGGNDGHHKQQQQQIQQQQQTQAKELEYWERLPSRNVSFSPAEVLTISECLQESIARLYCQEGRSVRITGLIANRSMDATGIVMELKDPVATTTAVEAETIRQTLGTSLKKRPRLSLSSTNSKKRPRNKQRPWFVSTSNAKSTLSLQNNQKTPKTTLGVIVDPGCVMGSALERATVGSFVTIIGEFIATRDSTMDAREDSQRYCVQARTLTVSSTATNMVLYKKALELRRQTMYKRYFYQTTKTDSKVLQGCGPPPYDVFHRGLDKGEKPVD